MSGARVYTTTELLDHAFSRAHEADIMLAMHQGRIKNNRKTPASLRDWPALRREPTPTPEPPAPLRPPRSGNDFSRIS
jgi:hypothetical protein